MPVVRDPLLLAAIATDRALAQAGEKRATRQHLWLYTQRDIFAGVSDVAQARLTPTRHIYPGGFIQFPGGGQYELGWPQGRGGMLPARRLGTWVWSPGTSDLNFSAGWEAEAEPMAYVVSSEEDRADQIAVLKGIRSDDFVTALQEGWLPLGWRWASIRWLSWIWHQVAGSVKGALRKAMAEAPAFWMENVPLCVQGGGVVPASLQTLDDPCTDLFYPGWEGLEAFRAVAFRFPIGSGLQKRMEAAWWGGHREVDG